MRGGFTGMSAERQREVSSPGGRAASAKGVSHKWSKEEASAAGKKGAAVRRAKAEQRAVAK